MAAARPSKKPSPGSSEPVTLLSGGNPKIAKGDGDSSVQAYIAAMPGWKRPLGELLDRLIVQACPEVRKADRSYLRPPRVLEYLLLDRSCPRTVLFCLDACLASLAAISGDSDRPERAFGRLGADLSFLDVSELAGPRVEPLLDGILRGIDASGNELADAYFTTRVFVPGPYTQAQQQQQ